LRAWCVGPAAGAYLAWCARTLLGVLLRRAPSQALSCHFVTRSLPWCARGWIAPVFFCVCMCGCRGNLYSTACLGPALSPSLCGRAPRAPRLGAPAPPRRAEVRASKARRARPLLHPSLWQPCTAARCTCNTLGWTAGVPLLSCDWPAGAPACPAWVLGGGRRATAAGATQACLPPLNGRMYIVRGLARRWHFFAPAASAADGCSASGPFAGEWACGMASMKACTRFQA
jgi:hypothetical protein